MLVASVETLERREDRGHVYGETVNPYEPSDRDLRWRLWYQTP